MPRGLHTRNFIKIFIISFLLLCTIVIIISSIITGIDRVALSGYVNDFLAAFIGGVVEYGRADGGVGPFFGEDVGVGAGGGGFYRDVPLVYAAWLFV